MASIWQVKSMPKNLFVEKQIAGISEATKAGIRKSFYYVGKDLTRVAKKLIQHKQKTGRIYKIKRLERTITHQASAAGEAPANLTGKLKKSIAFRVKGSDQLEFGALSGELGASKGVNYGRALERGTSKAGKRHNIKISPRPFIIRAIKLNYRNAQNHLSREINKSLTKTP